MRHTISNSGRAFTPLSIDTVESGSGTLASLTQSKLAEMAVLDPVEVLILHN